MSLNPFTWFAAREAAPIDRQEPVLVNPTELTKPQVGPTTSWSRNPYGGHPAAGITPQRMAQILKSSIQGSPQLYLELAEDMEERFPQYYTALSTRKRQVSRLDFRVDAAGEDSADLAEAEFIREIVNTAAFKLSKIDQLDAIGKGFSCTEMIWQSVNGHWKPIAFDYRDPRFFEFDQVNPELIKLRDDGGLVDLKPNGWLVHRAKAKSGLTIRGGLARLVAPLFMYATYNTKDWAIFAEAFGQPIRLGKFDPGASEDDKKILARAMQSIGVDFWGIIPAAMSMEVIGADIAGSTDLYERKADWLDRQASKVVLGQTGTTDGVKGGGYAQSKVHDGVRDDIADADAEQWAATLNSQLVQPAILFNFPHRDRKGFPEIVIGRPEDEDIDALVDNVTKLVPFGLEVSMSEMQRKVGVKAPAKGDQLLIAPAAAAQSGSVDLANLAVPPKFDKSGNPVPARAMVGHGDSIDTAVQEMLAGTGWERLVAPMTDGVKARLALATSADEAKAILASAFAGMDTAELTELMANAMFAARLAGELDEVI